MAVVINHAFVGRAFPENVSRIAVQTQHLESLFPVARDAVRMNPGFAFSDVMNGLCPRNDFAFDACGQKDSRAPDDRRRMAAAWDRRFPEDVFIRAPLGGKVLLVGNSQS